ncbi:class I SAM-dependent methyltransferase [Maribellus maritimus]|uniref:class I SAM-dependent methyltransferase n=1 Tax=Maribellus maritimus TaxID=2870838 RepID=UPI001EEB0A37|nr:class I SAM-dependent methyltransferase [Maribellus maritimus]MCG6185905.1 class I SAM-dependent methyltransferase [Maribellus maritimus]
MTEFWEENFIDKQEMWGLEPSESAILTKDYFLENSVKNILIPGIGYGRNAQPFIESGITVSGIEISKTAIELAKKHYGTEMTIHHGSVTEMPFDDNKYEGIFCYALVHLLDKNKRTALLKNCYNQLNDGGVMVFTAITKDAPNFGKGERISEDRYELHKGAKIFYYDQEAVKTEFNDFGLFEINKVNENQPMFLIKCRKK